MSIEINIEASHYIYIKKGLDSYIIEFNNIDTTVIHSKDSLLILLLNVYKNKFESNEVTIKLQTFDNIELSCRKFYSYISAYTFTVSLLTILESINKNQIDGLYKSVLIQETKNDITNFFPEEIVQEICSWLYF